MQHRGALKDSPCSGRPAKPGQSAANDDTKRPGKEKPEYTRNTKADPELLAYKPRVKKICQCLSVASPSKAPANPPMFNSGVEICIKPLM